MDLDDIFFDGHGLDDEIVTQTVGQARWVCFDCLFTETFALTQNSSSKEDTYGPSSSRYLFLFNSQKIMFAFTRY